MSTLASRLRAARLRKVWTQENLAAASGVRVVTISRLENGRVSGLPRQSTVRKLADALDVDGAWLLFGVEEAGANGVEVTSSSGGGKARRAPTTSKPRAESERVLGEWVAEMKRARERS